MEAVEKDVICLILNKRESFLWLYISFSWGYRGKKYKLLSSTFRNNSTPSKHEIDEFLKICSSDLFNYDNLD